MGILSWLFGSGSPPSIPAQAVPPLSQYPTSADAANAQRVGNWYGSPVAPYAAGQTAQVYGPGGVPQSGVGSYLDELNLPANAMRIEPDERLGLGDLYGRAALAANRIPIAQLGFDPRQITMDVMTDPSAVNVGGVYSPGTDRLFAISGQGADTASTPVHEFIHRGLEMLRRSGKLPEDESSGGDEEHLVRAIMESMAGNPEQDPMSLKLKAENAGDYSFDDYIKAINAAASGEIARRTPRGPR